MVLMCNDNNEVVVVQPIADKGETVCLSERIKPLGPVVPGHRILFTDCADDLGEA